MAPSAEQPIGVGIDFGTSNSAVAICDGDEVRMVSMEPASEPPQDIMPTATYIDRALHTQTGQDAIDQYVQDNTGRTVELIPEVIGHAAVLVGGKGGNSREAPDTLSQAIYGQPYDAGMKGRLFRGVKRLLGDPHMRRLMVFDHPYRPVALITPVLLNMRKRIEQELAGRPYRVYVGHPINFEGRDTHKNKLALSRLEEACGYAGFKSVEFYPEPLAATLSYMQETGHDDGLVIAVDFGGGTLDLCAMRRRRDGHSGTGGYEVLGTYGEPVGGDHIDQALFRHYLFPLLGKGESWRRRGVDRDVIETRFPFDEFEPLLLNWAVTYLLNQNRYTTPVLDCIEQGGPAAEKFQRLRDFINHNYGYRVFGELKDLKAQLSWEAQAELDMPEIDVQATVTRSEFESVIAPLLGQVEAAVEGLLQAAAIKPEDVSMVVRTGGSSLIPAVRRILEVRFPGRVVEHDPFTSVGTGLALAAAQGEHFHSQ